MPRVKFLLFALLIFAPSAVAADLPIYADRELGLIAYFSELFKTESRRLVAIRSARAMDAVASPNCRSVYKQIYDSKQLKVRISLGYFDDPDPSAPHKGYVYDKSYFFALRDHLMQPCQAGYFACGFKRVGESSYQLTKVGKRLDGTPVQILLTVLPSSISWNQAWNQGEGNREGSQTRQSKMAREHMLLGMTDADVFFYYGHSRTGGGPDFNPAYLNAKGMTDYARYRRERPGFRLMADALMASKAPPKLVGFFSCDSLRWFDRLFEEVSPNTGFIGTLFNPNKAKQTDRGMLAALDSVLGQKCQAGFEESLNIVEDAKTKHLGKRVFGIRRLF